ncbi:hypothetical protein EC988_003262 [Linderina pennispora]|nr:hypothetical protein EC988_003262 [Linderina pennispora]
MLWRYRGLGDMRHVRMRTDMALREFLTSYEEFGNATRVYRSWDEYLAQRPYMKMSLYYKALEYYVSAGERVRRRFLDEVVTLATRVNYMQDIDTINLLSAHVSMAPTSEDVYSVAGGNWQVFDRMIRESRATLNFNTTITAVQREGGKYTLALGSNQTTAAFDSVIIAAPLSVSGLDVLGQKDVPVKYVTMYVTFAIGVLRPGFFPPGTIPQLTVTTYHTTAPFNCLSILACLDDALACHQGTVLVKIFSHEPVDLNAVFERVEWQREQRWHSYPQLIPRNARYVQENGDHAYRSDRPGMPPIVMDEHAGGGVYYVNGMESLFSTMESQTVAARHVVQLVVLGKEGFDSVRMAGADEPA